MAVGASNAYDPAYDDLKRMDVQFKEWIAEEKKRKPLCMGRASPHVAGLCIPCDNCWLARTSPCRPNLLTSLSTTRAWIGVTRRTSTLFSERVGSHPSLIGATLTASRSPPSTRSARDSARQAGDPDRDLSPSKSRGLPTAQQVSPGCPTDGLGLVCFGQLRHAAPILIVFVSERGSPFSSAGFPKMIERAGAEGRLRFQGAPPHAAARPAASPSQMPAMTPAPCTL
jgi:hypothetical protein